MFVDTRYRSNEPEIMDNFDMEGEILRDALDKIASINRLLGGNRVTLHGLEELLCIAKKTGTLFSATSPEIRILDVGCGNGDMLRTLADYGLKNGLNFRLRGMDANNFTIGHARQLSANYQNIDYVCGDIFEEIQSAEQYDIILCTLTLHHFKDAEIIGLLKAFYTRTNMGIVINDLQRSALAYYLFTALCFVFRLNRMSKGDGLISILRGFKRPDLKAYAQAIAAKNYIIRWKWAFRYQFILPKL